MSITHKITFGDHDTAIIELKLSELAVVVDQARAAYDFGLCKNEAHKEVVREALEEFESFLEQQEEE